MLKKIPSVFLLLFILSNHGSAQEPITKFLEVYSDNFSFVSNDLKKYRQEYQLIEGLIKRYVNLTYSDFIIHDYKVSNEQNKINPVLTNDMAGQNKDNPVILNKFLIFVLFLFLLAIIYVLYVRKQLKIVLDEIQKIDLNNTGKSRLKSGVKGQVGGLVNFINRLFEQIETLKREKNSLITVDKISGLMNRRHFIETAKKEVSRSERLNSNMALIYCDIDTFKGINIQFGYEMGDQVLKEFANVLISNVRDYDYVCRWGGEVFLILCPETDLESARNLAETLRIEVSQMELATKKRITASFGAAERLPNEAFNYLCRRADEALYQAKKHGRNTVCVID